jgi:hypothetical protein
MVRFVHRFICSFVHRFIGSSVGVGSAVARALLHSSGRAELPHPDSALSNKAKVRGQNFRPLCSLRDIPFPLHRAYLSGSESGACRSGEGSSASFHSSPAFVAPFRDTLFGASRLLCTCPTFRVGTSLGYVLRLSNAACRTPTGRQKRDIPLPT